MKKQYTKAGATLFALLMLLASAGVVRAQEAANPLTVSYQNLTLMRDTARAKKQAATVVAPNDTLRYTLKFTNTQSRAVTNVVFTNPIPGGLHLVPGTIVSPVSARVEYSIDGGLTYAAQPMVSVTENGRTIQRPATPESYTNIRWTITDSIAPSASVTARYDARVAGR